MRAGNAAFAPTPDLVGMGTLGRIAGDIDLADSQRTGYWIGFFSRIEHLIFDTGATTWRAGCLITSNNPDRTSVVSSSRALDRSNCA